MRFILLITILLLSSQPIFADDPTSPIPDSIRIERLAGLCELWGVVKYFHPYLAYKDIDWDKALIKTIPKVNKAETPEDYRRAIQHMISFLQDPNTYIIDENYEFPRSKISDLPEEEWYPSVIWAEDSIAIISVSNFDRVYEYGLEMQDYKFEGSIRSIIERANGVIIDARYLSGPLFSKYSENDTSWALQQYFTLSLLDIIGNVSILEPSTRSRSYSPFRRLETPYYSHEAGFFYDDPIYLYLCDDTINYKPCVYIINEGSADLLPMLGVLQDNNIGAIIFEGPFDRDGGIKTYRVKLPHKIDVKVRMTEIVIDDGAEAVHPNIVIPFTTDTTLLDCPPIKTAVDIINGRRDIPPGVAKSIVPASARTQENTYCSIDFPKPECQLLELFKFWNEVRYFYAYQSEIKDSWGVTLRRFIPVFENAIGKSSHVKAKNELANVSSGFWASGSGAVEFFPSFNVQLIEDKTVITYAGEEDSCFTTNGLTVGDIVLELDEEDIVMRRQKISNSFSSPTPQAEERLINTELLKSLSPSPIKIKIRKHDNRIEDYDIPRSARGLTPSVCNPSQPEFEEVVDGIQYLRMEDLGGILSKELIDIIMKSKSLILDLRSFKQYGFPLIFEWDRLVSILAQNDAAALIKRGIERSSPDPNIFSWGYIYEKVVPDAEYNYKGNVVALIDASTYGWAERLCLYLKASANTTSLGSATAGIPYMLLEESMMDLALYRNLQYVNIDIRFPDDTPLYGVGIQPDIYVEPTIEGIRQGRDEILEAAIEYLENELKK
jgi:hypothetical protein